jgi:Xaa-Pro aminopeptidase
MGSAQQRIDALRVAMKAAEVDVYLVPSSDPHQSEYVPDAWQRRAWISGFTGSMGDCAVTQDGAFLWTDSRYWLQGEAELDGDVWTLMRLGADDVPTLPSWLGEVTKGTVVGFDPRLVGLATVRKMSKALAGQGATLKAVDTNLVDAVWTDRPSLPNGPIATWSTEYAGTSAADKLALVRADMTKSRADAVIVTTLDALAWLLNLRGADVAFNPIFIGYAIIRAQDATLYVDPSKVGAEVTEHLAAAGVGTAPYEAVSQGLAELAGRRVWVDEQDASHWVVSQLEAGKCDIIAKRSPLQMHRARKNPTEIAGMRAAHIRDGVAVSRYLHWLTTAWQGGDLDEISASDQLERFRSEGDRFKGLSFDTISGFAGNGAIVHYRATPATAKVIDDSTLYLCDSGGQYLDGTTDITRTLHLGTPTETERAHFTRVLQGHLGLRHAVFPKKTTGTQLDGFARRPLWEAGLNYGHGTGHGVGCYLSVHQGPHRVSPGINSVGLEPGMVLSNEPGLYIAGQYGIRIENLCVVAERAIDNGGAGDFGPFYGLDDLTMAPYCRNLIDVTLLSETERKQVDAYHAQVRETLAPLMEGEARDWMINETAPL